MVVQVNRVRTGVERRERADRRPPACVAVLWAAAGVKIRRLASTECSSDRAPFGLEDLARGARVAKDIR